ncbi:hypothetical protein HDU77_004349 [Chytriomyces hyalinus]|nr:hypothetical protein HDU77_004349 [Chytriomyces hyalinus]
MTTPVVPVPAPDESAAALPTNAVPSSTSTSTTIATTGFIQSRRSDSPAPTRANSLVSNTESAADGDHVPEFMSLKLKSVKQDSYSPTSTISSIYSGGPVPTKSVSKKSSVTHWPKVKDLVKNIETDPAEESAASPLQLDQLTPSQIRAYSPTLLDRPNPTEAVKSIFCNPDESLPLPTLTPAERVGREARELRTRSRSVIKPNYMTPEVSTFSDAWNYGARSRRGSEYSDTATSEHSTLYLRSKSTPAPVSRPPSPESRGDAEPANGAMDLIMSVRSTPTIRPQQEYPANVDSLKTDPEISKPEIDGNTSDGSDCSTLSTRVTKIKSSHPSSVTPQKPVEKVNSLREYFETVAGSSSGSPSYSVSPSFQRSFTSPPINSSSLSTSATDASTEFQHLHSFGISGTESAFFATKRRASSPGLETKGQQQALPSTASEAEDIYDRHSSANEKLSDETQLKREFKSVVHELEFRLRDREEVAPRTTEYSPYNSTPDRVVRVKEILKTAVVPGSFGYDVSRLDTDGQNVDGRLEMSSGIQLNGNAVIETSTISRTTVNMTEMNYPLEKLNETQSFIQSSSITASDDEAQAAVLPATLKPSIESESTAIEIQSRDSSSDNIAVASLRDPHASKFTTQYSQKRISEISSSDTNEKPIQETNVQTTVTTVITTTTTTTSKSAASSTPVRDVRFTSIASEQTAEKESVQIGRETAIQDSQKHSVETDAVVRKMSIASLLSESGPSFLRGRSSSNRKVSADSESLSIPALPLVSEGEATSHSIVTKTISETHDSSELLKDTTASVECDNSKTEIDEGKKTEDVPTFSSVLKMFRSRASTSTASAPIADNSLVDHGLEVTQPIIAGDVPSLCEPQEPYAVIASVTEIPAISDIARKESLLGDDGMDANESKTTTSTTSTTITTTTSEKTAESTAAVSVVDSPAALAPRRKVVLTMRRKSATQRATEASDSNSMAQTEPTAIADQPVLPTTPVNSTDELLIMDSSVAEAVSDVRADEVNEPKVLITEESTPMTTTTIETETITTRSTRRSLTSAGEGYRDEMENANQESTSEEKLLSTEGDSCVLGQSAPSYEAVEFPTSEEIIIESELKSETPLIEGESFSSELTVTPARHVITAEGQSVDVDGARNRDGAIVDAVIAVHEASKSSETVAESSAAGSSPDADTFATVTKTTVIETHVSVSAEAVSPSEQVLQKVIVENGTVCDGSNSSVHVNGGETRHTTETIVTVEKTIGFSPAEVPSHTTTSQNKDEFLTSMDETTLSSERFSDASANHFRTQTEAEVKIDVLEEKSTKCTTIESPAVDEVSDMLADDIILAEGGFTYDSVASAAADDAYVTEYANASPEPDVVQSSSAVSNSAGYQSVSSIPVVRESKSVFSSLFSSFRSRPVLKPAPGQPSVHADSNLTTGIVTPSAVSGAAEAVETFIHAKDERISENESSRVFVEEVHTAENHIDQSEMKDEEGSKDLDFKAPSFDNLHENAVIDESVQSTSEDQPIVSRTVVVTEESGAETPKNSTVAELTVTEAKGVSEASSNDALAVMPPTGTSVACEEMTVHEIGSIAEMTADSTVEERSSQHDALHNAAEVSAIVKEPADEFINSSYKTQTITTITVTRSIEGFSQMEPSLQEGLQEDGFKSSLHVSEEAPSKIVIPSEASNDMPQVEIATDAMNGNAVRASTKEHLPIADFSNSSHSNESAEKDLKSGDRPLSHLTAVEFGKTTEELGVSKENAETEGSGLIVEAPAENDNGVTVSSGTYSTSHDTHFGEAGSPDEVLPKESQEIVATAAASENPNLTFSSIFSAFSARKFPLATVPIANDDASAVSEITSEKPGLRNNSQTIITEKSETSLTTTVAELDLPETSKAKILHAETEAVIENVASTYSVPNHDADGGAHTKSLNESVLYLQQQLEDLSKVKVSSTRTLETALEAKMKSNVVETEVSNSKSLPTVLPNAKTHVLKRSKHSIQLIPKQKSQTESSGNETDMTLSDNIFSPTTGVEVINVKLSDLVDMESVQLEEVWDSESHSESPSSWSAKNSALSPADLSVTTEPLNPVSVVDMLSASPTHSSSPVKLTSEDTVEVVKLKDLEEIEKGYRRLSGIWQPGQEQLTSTVVGSAVETELLTSFMNAVPAQESPVSTEANSVKEVHSAVQTIQISSKTQDCSGDQETSKVSPSPAATSMKSMFQKLFGARSDRGSDGYERIGLLKEEDESIDSSEPLLKTHESSREIKVIKTNSIDYILTKLRKQERSVKETTSLDVNSAVEVPHTERVVKPTRSALQLRKVLSLIDSAMDDLAEDGIECESASDFESRSIRTVSSMSSMKNDASFGILSEGAKQTDNDAALDSRNDDAAPKSTLTSLFSTFRSRKSSLKPPSTYSAVGTIDEDDSEFEGDAEATVTMPRLSGASTSHAHDSKTSARDIGQDTTQTSQESYEAVTSLFPNFRSRTSSLNTTIEAGPVISVKSPVLPKVEDDLPLFNNDNIDVSNSAESEKQAIITQSCETSTFDVETTTNEKGGINMEISNSACHHGTDASLISQDEAGVASDVEGKKSLGGENIHVAGVPECESPDVVVEGGDHQMPVPLAVLHDEDSEMAMGLSSSFRVVQILETVTTESFPSEMKAYPPEAREVEKKAATASSIIKELSETVESASFLSSRSEELGCLETGSAGSKVETYATNLNPTVIVHEEISSFQSHMPAEVHEEKNQTDTSAESKSSGRDVHVQEEVHPEFNSGMVVLGAAQHSELVFKHEDKKVDETEQSASTELVLAESGFPNILQKHDECLRQPEFDSGSQTHFEAATGTANAAAAMSSIETTTETSNCFTSSNQLTLDVEPDVVQTTVVDESKDAELPSISTSDESLMHLDQTTVSSDVLEDAAQREEMLTGAATQGANSIETKLAQDSKISPVTYSNEFVIEEPIAVVKEAKSVFSSIFSTFHTRPSLKVSDSATLPNVNDVTETVSDTAHRDDVRQQPQPSGTNENVSTQMPAELGPAEEINDAISVNELMEAKTSSSSEGAIEFLESEQISIQVHTTTTTVTTDVVRIDESRPVIASKLVTNLSNADILTEHFNQLVEDFPTETDLNKEIIHTETIEIADSSSGGFPIVNNVRALPEREWLVDSSKPVALNVSETVETITSTVSCSDMQMTSPLPDFETKVNVEAGVSGNAVLKDSKCLSFNEEIVIQRVVTEQVTPAATEQVTVEKVRTEQVTSEEVITEDVTIEPVTTDQVITEQVVAEQVITDQVVTEQVVTEQVTTEQVATEQVATEQAATEQVGTEQVINEQVRREQVIAEQGATEKVTTEQVTTEHITTQHITTEHITTEQVATEHITTEQVAIEQVTTDQSTEQVTDEKTTAKSATVEQITTVHVATERNCVEHSDAAEGSSADAHKALDSLDEPDSLPSAPPMPEKTVDQNSIFTSLLSSFGTRKSSMNSGLVKEMTSESESGDIAVLSRTAVIEEVVVTENETSDSGVQGLSDKDEKICSTIEKGDTEATTSELSGTRKVKESPQCVEEKSHEEKAGTFSFGTSISEISFGNSTAEMVRSTDTDHSQHAPQLSDENAVVHTSAEEEYRVFPVPAKTRKSMISMFSSWSKPIASVQTENDTTKHVLKSSATSSAVESTVQHGEMEPHIDAGKQTNTIQVAVIEPHSADTADLIVQEPHNSAEAVVALKKVFDAPNVGGEISLNTAGSDRSIIASEREVQVDNTTSSSSITTTTISTTTTTTIFGTASTVEHGSSTPSLEKELGIVSDIVPCTQTAEKAVLEPFGHIESISQCGFNEIAAMSHESASPAASNGSVAFSAQTTTSELHIAANVSDLIRNSGGQREFVQSKSIRKRAYISSSAVIEVVRVKASFTFTSESVCSTAAVYCTLGNWWASVAMALVSSEPYIYAAEVELPASVHTGDSVLYSFIIDGVWVEVPDANVQKCGKAFQVYLVPDISDRSFRRNASLVTEAWNIGKDFSKSEKAVSSAVRQELQQEVRHAVQPEEIASSIIMREEQREEVVDAEVPQKRGISGETLVFNAVTQETILSSDEMERMQPRTIEAIEMPHQKETSSGEIAVQEVITVKTTDIPKDQIEQGIITEEAMPQQTPTLSEVVVEERVVSVDVSQRYVRPSEEVAQIVGVARDFLQEKIIPSKVTQADHSIVGNETQHDTSQSASTSDSNVSSMHTAVDSLSSKEIVHHIVETRHHQSKSVDLTEKMLEHGDRPAPADPAVESNAQPRMRFSFLSQWTRSNPQDETQSSSTPQKIALTDDSKGIATEESKSEEIAVLSTQATEISYLKTSTGETGILAASPRSETDFVPNESNLFHSLVQEEIPSVVKEARFDSCDTVVADIKEVSSGSALDVEEKKLCEKDSVSAIETTLNHTSQAQNAVSVESRMSLIQEKIYESPMDNYEERPADLPSSTAGQTVACVEKLSPASVGECSSKLSQVDDVQIITTVHTTKRTTTVTKNTSQNSSSKLSKLTELSGVNIARIGFLVLFVLYVIYQVLLAVIAPIYELFWDNFHPMWIGNVIMPVTLILVIFYMLNPST